MARMMEVVDYRPEWKEEYKKEAKKIRKILGKNCVAIFHIGSTSVPGLKAKPIIDIMPVVKDLSAVDAHNAQMEALGYQCFGEYGIAGRRFFAKGGDERTHHVHVFEEKNQQAVQRHLAVRAYLASHPERAAQYGALKERLAAEFRYDNDGYCGGKDAFMKELEQDALKWKKMQDELGKYVSYGLGFGIMLGCVFGLTIGNLVTGIVLGMCFGMCAGAVLWSGQRK